MSLNQFFKDRTPLGLYIMSLSLLGLLYSLNAVAPKGLSFALFYLGPIALVAWYLGYWRGISMSILATLAWYYTEAHFDVAHALTSIVYWNAFVRFIFFVIIVYLLTALHHRLREQERLADTDGLTGALNSRGFMQRAEIELERARRYGYACTLAYLDLDNFKEVNDHHGHAAGDVLLKELVGLLRSHTRGSDLVGRLGGDEFAIFYAETDGDAGMKAIRKLRLHLSEHMSHAQWPVTVSIGAVTVHNGECGLGEMIKMADNLMYTVKSEGKDSVRHRELDAVPL